MVKIKKKTVFLGTPFRLIRPKEFELHKIYKRQNDWKGQLTHWHIFEKIAKKIKKEVTGLENVVFGNLL